MYRAAAALFSSLLGICLVLSGCAVSTPDMPDKKVSEAEMIITILYDNKVVDEKTTPDWGFSCLVETGETTILFDTGKNSEILLQNAEKLEISLSAIDHVVISHNHPDHTGGLDTILQKNPGIPVYFPVSLQAAFSESISKHNGVPIAVSEPRKIAEHVYITGEMGQQIKEQSLILDTGNGLVIITGCSHQGIVNILEFARNMLHKDIRLVLGGFHLQNQSNAQIAEIIGEFQNIGVKQCGASHCSGDASMTLFESSYGENFITMGVGKVLRFSY